jgi:hypothetical protein
MPACSGRWNEQTCEGCQLLNIIKTNFFLVFGQIKGTFSKKTTKAERLSGNPDMCIHSIETYYLAGVRCVLNIYTYYSSVCLPSSSSWHGQHTYIHTYIRSYLLMLYAGVIRQKYTVEKSWSTGVEVSIDRIVMTVAI